MIIGDRFRVFNLRRIKLHRMRSAASVLGIASGVALVVAMSSLLTSVTATANSTVRLLGGATYEVVGTSTTSDQLIRELRTVTGVSGVRRFVESPILVDGSFGWLIGLDPSAIPDSSGNTGSGAAVGAAKSSLSNADAMALAATRGVTAGSQLPASGTHTIAGLTGTTIRIEMNGRASSRLVNRYGGRFIAADINTALRLRGILEPDSWLVYGSPDPKQLAKAVDGLARVRPTADRVTRAKNTIQILFSSLSILGAMGLIVGGFLMFNTMNMAVLDRRKEMASLRALGSDKRSLWRGVLTEAALLGTVGSVLGLLLGAVMARSVIASVPDAASRSIGTQLAASVPAWLLTAGFVFGVGTSLIASISPARRTLNIEPLLALRPDTGLEHDQRVLLRPLPLLLGIALAGIVTFSSNATMAPAFALAACVVALLLAMYGAGPRINRIVVLIARRLGPGGQLAALSLERSPRRVWATTATVIVSIAIAVTTTGLVVNFRATASQDMRTALRTDFWIGTTSGDSIAVTGLPKSWTAKMAAIPGVRAVAGSRWIATEANSHIVGIQGVQGDSSYSFSRLANDDARAAMLAGRGVIVIKAFAQVFHVKIGDVIDVPGATPLLKLPVLAVTNGVAPNSGGMVILSHDLFVKHFGIDTFARYEVHVASNADRTAVHRAIDRIVATAGFPVRVDTAKEFLAAGTKASDQLLSLIAMVLLVIVVCAGIALLNTLLASVLERSREIAVLRAIGATQRQLVRSTVCEAAAIGLTGGILGVVSGSLFHWIAVDRLRNITLFHIVYSFSVLAAVLAILTGIGVALLGASIPARRVARLDLLSALVE